MIKRYIARETHEIALNLLKKLQFVYFGFFSGLRLYKNIHFRISDKMKIAILFWSLR